jgi:hypothetical protein
MTDDGGSDGPASTGRRCFHRHGGYRGVAAHTRWKAVEAGGRAVEAIGGRSR